MDPNLESLIRLAEHYIGTPYLYGGKNMLSGYDCSGFCSELLRSVGLVGYKESLSALGLHEKLRISGTKTDVSAPAIGSIIFFGSGSDNIVHCSLVVSPYSVIEAGGGDHTVTTLSDAVLKGACVRKRSINYRTDKWASYLPPYPWNQK